MKFTSSIVLAGALAMGNLAAAAFDKVCRDYYVVGGGIWEPLLVAECNFLGKPFHKTKFNLSNCYGVSGGAIVYKDGGNLQHYCQTCSSSGTIMTCSCKNDSGAYVDMTHDLNTGMEIYDDNGYLRCFDHKGEDDPYKKAEVFTA